MADQDGNRSFSGSDEAWTAFHAFNEGLQDMRYAARQNVMRLKAQYEDARLNGDDPAARHALYLLVRHAMTVCERLGVKV